MLVWRLGGQGTWELTVPKKNQPAKDISWSVASETEMEYCMLRISPSEYHGDKGMKEVAEVDSDVTLVLGGYLGIHGCRLADCSIPGFARGAP